MEKVRFKDVFAEARQSFSDNYLIWALGVILPTLVVVGLLYLFRLMFGEMLANHFWASIYLTVIYAYVKDILIWAFAFFFTKKFFLVLTRQPKLVKQNLLESLKYTYSDGFIKRLGFLFLYALFYGVIAVLLFLGSNLLLTIVFQGIEPHYQGVYKYIWDLIKFFVVIPLIFIMLDSLFWLLPYIAQDTLSNDNQRESLSFWACMMKSVKLVKDNFWSYIGVMLLNALVAYLIQMTGFFGIFTLLKFLTFDLFILVLKTTWADAVMAQDDEIVDYGDY